jgi:gliding motility-associated-like protein
VESLSLMATTSSMDNGWDGIFEGKPMPASDYWFMVESEDGNVFKNHFSLMR